MSKNDLSIGMIEKNQVRIVFKKKSNQKKIRKWPKNSSKERENGGHCSEGALNLRPTIDVDVVNVVGDVRRRLGGVVVEEKALQSAFQLCRLLLWQKLRFQQLFFLQTKLRVFLQRRIGKIALN